MKRNRLAVTLAALTLPSPAVLADRLDVRRPVMEVLMAQVETPADRQAGEITAREARSPELSQHGESGDAADSAALGERITVSGLIEIEAAHESVDNGGGSNDIVAGSVELAIGARISDWVTAEMVAKYEDDSDTDGDLDIDSATVSIADPEGPWFANVGKYTLPFGAFPSFMISDPLTLELGETLDSAIEVGVSTGTFTASAFAFEGDRQDEMSSFGLRASLSTEVNDVGVKVQLGYLNDLAEADTIVDAGWVAAGDDRVPAWIASAELAFGEFTLMAEYLAATKEFASAGNDKPSAYMLEAAYAFNALGRPAAAAIGYQRTRDARDDNWGLPKKRVLGTVMLELVEGVALGVEFRRDTDYADEITDTVTGQLAVEF